MDGMENFRERFEAVEAHMHAVERRLRWWRGIACGLLIVGLVSVVLPSGKTVDAQQGGLPARVAALEDKLVAVTFDSATKELVITGANLRIVNGLGSTETTNGLGNLIVGYNELRGASDDRRTGSHNVVVGKLHNFPSFGGLVVARFNEISGPFASISGGEGNTASGFFASVSGGTSNTASGGATSVSGGQHNTASGFLASVSGGRDNTASAEGASVSAGQGNTASGVFASVSGGQSNTASGLNSSVSGGVNNTASEHAASVSGGANRTAPGENNWAAGTFFSAN